MDKQQEAKLKKLGIFSIEQALGLGLTQQGLSRLVAAQKLTRVGRGLYLHPDAALKGDIGFQVACAKFGPKSAIAGLSALFHYNLVEQVPGHIWIVVPPEKRTSEAGYTLIRTKISMEKCIIFANGFRIVSLERAVLEGLKLITKIGERTAIKAARDALANRRTTVLKLGKCAQELGLEKVLKKYIEVIAP
jgi:predicted transcriptional regulator of viral defense system